MAETAIQAVTPEELAEAYKGAALYANKFYVTASGPVARISFTESPPNQDPVFRAAVAMTLEDLLKLGKVIEDIAKKTQTISVGQQPVATGVDNG